MTTLVNILKQIWIWIINFLKIILELEIKDKNIFMGRISNFDWKTGYCINLFDTENHHLSK